MCISRVSRTTDFSRKHACAWHAYMRIAETPSNNVHPESDPNLTQAIILNDLELCNSVGGGMLGGVVQIFRLANSSPCGGKSTPEGQCAASFAFSLLWPFLLRCASGPVVAPRLRSAHCPPPVRAAGSLGRFHRHRQCCLGRSNSD